MNLPEKIHFKTDWRTAFEAAAKEGKEVFLDFFTNDCIGCREMALSTYEDRGVADFLNSRVIPLAIDPDALPWSEDYHCRWTPHLLVLDAAQAAHQTSYGYLPPAELVPWVLLGLAKCSFKARDFAGAAALLQEALACPDNTSRPEIIYYLAVARARNEGNAARLKQMQEDLTRDHPGNPWTIRAFPYRLL